MVGPFAENPLKTSYKLPAGYDLATTFDFYLDPLPPVAGTFASSLLAGTPPGACPKLEVG